MNKIQALIKQKRKIVRQDSKETKKLKAKTKIS